MAGYGYEDDGLGEGAGHESWGKTRPHGLRGPQASLPLRLRPRASLDPEMLSSGRKLQEGRAEAGNFPAPAAFLSAQVSAARPPGQAL